MSNQPTVIIGLSGGVDSSIAAHLLKEQGYRVIGATAILWPDSLCCSDQSLKDAKRVAEFLGIEYHLVNIIPQFGAQVIQYFVDEYYAGKTPNPCTICNRLIKFGLFFDQAVAQLGLDPDNTLYATGHYASVIEQDGRYIIKQGLDQQKDQSYMLYNLTQQQLKRTIMPLGGYQKADIKKISQQLGLQLHQKPESQDACFVNGDYKRFIKDFSGREAVPGNFVLRDGTVLGKHQGINNYTIGQRRGLFIAYSQPLYVLELNIEKNEVVLGTKAELLAGSLGFIEPNWQIAPPTQPIRAKIKIRYATPAQDGLIDPIKQTIVFDAPVEAITPGQAVVFYKDNLVLGGGIIAR